MLVKDYMTRHPLMVDPAMSITEAQRYMGENNVRHLPVVGDGKRLVGLVTRQTLMVDPSRLGSLNVWEIARYLTGLAVKDVMVKARDVTTIGPDTTIEEASCIMVSKKIGCLPVIGEGIVVGIITEVDLLAHLMEMMAAPLPGVRVTVRMPNVHGELARLVAEIAGQGWPILALGGTSAPKDPDHWDAVVKIGETTLDRVVAVLAGVTGQEIIDVREVGSAQA